MINALRVLSEDLKSKRPSSGENFDALDGIRGLAVLMVVMHHTDGYVMTGQGRAGVLLFFVLSGFLLTMPASQERTISWWRFGTRRFLRIVPMYFAVLTATFLLGFQDTRFLLDHMSFIRADYHFWTIRQEVLFYCLFPGLIVLSRLLSRGNLFYSGVVLGLCATIANLWLDTRVLPITTNGLPAPFLVGAFLTGMTFAFGYEWLKSSRFWQGTKRDLMVVQISGFLSLIAILGLNRNVLDVDVMFPVAFTGSFGLMCGCLILAALLCKGTSLERIFSARPFRLLGFVSFSLYLIHPFVKYSLSIRSIPEGALLFLGTFTISLALSVFTYAFIERPCMRLGLRRASLRWPSRDFIRKIRGAAVT